jgi:hypothetical protein
MLQANKIKTDPKIQIDYIYPNMLNSAWMKRLIIIMLWITAALQHVVPQQDTAVSLEPLNRAGGLWDGRPDSKLAVGGYGQIGYNQPISSGEFQNGNLDVHRFVLLFGYQFTDRLQMVSEIEFEHVKEVFVEQAFLNYRINSGFNLRVGLLLIPMGIINEYHEPPTYNGTERPNVDKYMVPTTWREIGAGLSGTILRASLRYQAYIVNGFKGFGPEALFNGKNGLRSGRQKGAESIISSPNVSFKLDYFGITGLNIGFAGYFGKSQSTLYRGLNKDDQKGKITADSSVIGTSMIGLDLRYDRGGLQLRGQSIYNFLSNTVEYNEFTGSDLGSAMLGYYFEAGYNIFKHLNSRFEKLVPFLRYEKYNTHHGMAGNMSINAAFDRTDLTAGFGFWVTEGAVVKADYQWFFNAADQQAEQFNMGIGFMF